MIPRLREDHRRARLLATDLAKLEGIRLATQAVQTNIVMVTIERSDVSAHVLADELATRGIKTYPYQSDVIRFVTHRHITDEDIGRVVKETTAILGCERQSAQQTGTG
jgi:threonine aldolase